MARFVGPRIVTSGLVLSLDAANTKSYPGSGTTWTDLSGNNNTGTLTNGPTFSSANNGSIVFDGTNDYVQIPQTTLLDGTLSMTLSAWVFRSAAFNANNPFMGKGRTTAEGAGGYDFRIDVVSGTTYLNLVKYSVADQRVAYTFSTGTWYNLVAVQGASSVVYYVNGSNAGSFSNASSYVTITNPFLVGFGRNDGANSYWNGNISQVMFHNRQLSAAEVQQNFNAMRGRFGI